MSARAFLPGWRGWTPVVSDPLTIVRCSGPPMRATFATIAVLVAAFAAPAPAGAAELFPLHACYRAVGPDSRETIGIVAKDFAPGAEVSITVDGTTLPDNAVADENGLLLGSVLA